MNTYMAKGESIDRAWYVIDVEGQVLGRVASQVASILRGKHKPIYTPHVDTGDHVIIVNADKVVLTGKKLDRKLYRHHTGYVGGLKERTARQMLDRKPTFIVAEAIRGMLPHNSLGRSMYKKLRVYAGPDHEQAAQKPVALALSTRKGGR